MKNTSMNMKKDSREEESTAQFAIESLEAKEENLVSKKYRTKLEPEQTLILNSRRSRASAVRRELFFQNVHGFHCTIPKHITTFDEKYVLHCLELIRNCALRAAAWNFASKADFLPVDVSNIAEIENRDIYNMTRLAVECPSADGTEIVLNPTSDLIIGSVSASQSMINILKSPLLQQFGSLDYDVNFHNTRLLEPVFSDSAGYRQESGTMSSHSLQKEATILDKKYASPPVHKRVLSMSSTNSSTSDQSTSTSSSSFQGMLQCSWKDGLPHHAFTVDDKKEIFVANSLKVHSSDDKVLDYIYSFHLRKNGKKGCDGHELESESVGKMRVSTLITFCSNTDSDVRETQFILYNDSPKGDVQNENQSLRKHKRLTRKVVDVFRSNHSHKQRTPSKFGGSSAIDEDAIWEPSEDVQNSFDSGGATAEDKYVPNHELAAIIVKETIKNHKEVDLGGWGLKFLKKSGNDAPRENFKSTRSAGECSTSMNVLIPAGLHGGPRTRISGPSSLTERWISGGCCDCGGWDIGCPLTILRTKSRNNDSSCQADITGECKSVDLFIEGSRQNVPIMKMVNIHDGLYYIHFQSPLSSLQSFAIATAIIHSYNPVLRSKVCRSM